MLTEIKNLRHYDYNNSINRHSTRVYLFKGKSYLLDRETDSLPRTFTAYRITGARGLMPRVQVNGSDYFGHDVSWQKAIQMLEQELTSQN